MLDFIFGWRKASSCKKLMKRVQCRLKIIKNKRLTVARQLKVDIAQLLKTGYEQIAYSRLDQLFVDENMISLYELLDQYSEFIILNLSYIRRHKEVSNDVKEAVSTLVFASARCGDLPELRLIRKLFAERYGRRFTATAVELRPGNFVNYQVKDKLIPQSVPETVKNRLLDEIVREFIYKSWVLGVEHKPDFEAQPQKVIELYNSSPASSSPSIFETRKQEPCTLNEYAIARKADEKELSGCSSESLIQDYEGSVIYLDDIQEFKSPSKQGMHSMDQDQRFFMFSFTSLSDYALSNSDTTSIDVEKLEPKDCACRISSSLHQPCYSCTNNTEDSGVIVRNNNIYRDELRMQWRLSCRGQNYSPKRRFHATLGAVEYPTLEEEETGLTRPLPETPIKDSMDLGPYVRAATVPQIQGRSKSLSVVKLNGTRSWNTASLKHVHPKLPDYDEIAAKFKALKKVHQQNKCTTS